MSAGKFNIQAFDEQRFRQQVALLEENQATPTPRRRSTRRRSSVGQPLVDSPLVTGVSTPATPNTPGFVESDGTEF